MSNRFQIESASVTDRGLSKKRPQNEDSFLELPNSGIFAVADGVGGASAGEVASQMAMEILGEAFTNLPETADAEEVMKVALQRANTAIYQMSHDLPSLSSMATTVVALHIAGDIATIGHVGDSRLYRVDVGGNLYRETADHSVVAEEVRAGRMTQEQAENHPSRNIISRALGAEPTVDVELKTIMFDSGTTFLICSDGVTRHITDPEIRGMLASGAASSQIVEQIRALCFERGAEDNLTAVLVRAEAAGSEHERQYVNIPPIFEPPVSTAPFEAKTVGGPDDDEVLELQTRELKLPEEETPAAAQPSTEPIEPIDPSSGQQPPFPTERAISLEPEPPIVPVFEHQITPQIPAEAPLSQPEPARAEQDSSFDDQGSRFEEKKEKGSFGTIVSGVFLLLLGALVGLAGYHFVLLPTMQKPAEPQITEMKTANIPLTEFEVNRRNVDKDPAGYISKVAATLQPQSDSTDYYLLGRAYILVGDYPKARAALIEARNRLAYTETTNVNVLTTDIAMALAVTNEPTIQSLLKKELDSTKPATNVVVNANVNASNSNKLNVNVNTNTNR